MRTPALIQGGIIPNPPSPKIVMQAWRAIDVENDVENEVENNR